MKSNPLRYFKHDVPAGIVVFFVALPLCLGIALASGVPLLSGIITGIIGGVVVGALSGSQISVSGPAAGLTVIVLNAIESLGSLEVFFAAVVMAGALQIALGLAKGGIIGYYFPSAVIKGMLAAIGLLLIIKQLPYFAGVDPGVFGLVTTGLSDIDALRSTLTEALYDFDKGSLLVGLLSIATLFLWDSVVLAKVRFLTILPGALVAVCLAIVANVFFTHYIPDLAIGNEHLVNLPAISSRAALENSLIMPDFSMVLSSSFWSVVVALAVVASLETLLSIEAADKIDPFKRVTPSNRELLAQGTGNVLAGVLGGLPMTAVIVRSSANVSAGGRSKLSAIFHGLLLIAAVVVLSPLLNQIPLAALAAVLILVGFKLTKPALYKSMRKMGSTQLLPFLVTIIAILAFDMLRGIGIGLMVSVFFILKSNYTLPFRTHSEGNHLTIELSEQVSFLNKAALQQTLMKLEPGAKVTVDARLSRSIDYDAFEVIQNFKVSALEKGIVLNLIGFERDDLIH